jgi:hypothetical protein
MKCPHCLNSIHSNPRIKLVGEDKKGEWFISAEECPECGMFIIKLILGKGEYDGPNLMDIHKFNETIVNPKSSNREPCPEEVPESIANDYKEACLVITDSPKASAALSRRCLQSIIRDKAGVKRGDLSTEIQEVIDSKMLPSQISEAIDSVRNIGNFAAHPIKSKASGEILDVEENEAEWNLEVIEALFDFYYVAPKKMKDRKDKLNVKLKKAGKPEMK